MIKKFENFEGKKLFESQTMYKYKVGEYVLLDDADSPWRLHLQVKILDTGSNTDIEDLLENYYVEAYNKDLEISNFWVDEYEIERKMTKKEIKEWLTELEIKQNAKKYNL
jgi:hypothetical protein